MKDSISVMSSLDAIRRRPAMYVGDPCDPLTITSMMQGALCKALDAGCDGLAKSLEITIDPEGQWSIYQDHPWPLGVDDKASLILGGEISYPEIIMTSLYACRGEKSEERRHLCNTGLVAVNALSIAASVVVIEDKTCYQQAFKSGIPESPLRMPAVYTPGTLLRFELDPTIFPYREVNRHQLVMWLMDHQPEGMAITVRDNREASITSLAAK